MIERRQLPIDLNCDAGEGCAAEEALLEYVTSVNIACGVHAGSRETMIRSLELAQEAGVQLGAHPGFDDREHFGRRELSLAPEEVEELVARQLEELGELARERGMTLRHLKPHGGLYHVAMRDRGAAEGIARVAAKFDRGLRLVGLAGSELERAAIAQGLGFWREAFADRVYLASGELVPRSTGQGLWRDVERVVEQVVGIVTRGEVVAIDGSRVRVEADTICLHGDTPGVVEMARGVRAAVEGLTS